MSEKVDEALKARLVDLGRYLKHVDRCEGELGALSHAVFDLDRSDDDLLTVFVTLGDLTERLKDAAACAASLASRLAPAVAEVKDAADRRVDECLKQVDAVLGKDGGSDE